MNQLQVENWWRAKEILTTHNNHIQFVKLSLRYYTEIFTNILDLYNILTSKWINYSEVFLYIPISSFSDISLCHSLFRHSQKDSAPRTVSEAFFSFLSNLWFAQKKFDAAKLVPLFLILTCRSPANVKKLVKLY